MSYQGWDRPVFQDCVGGNVGWPCHYSVFLRLWISWGRGKIVCQWRVSGDVGSAVFGWWYCHSGIGRVDSRGSRVRAGEWCLRVSDTVLQGAYMLVSLFSCICAYWGGRGQERPCHDWIRWVLVDGWDGWGECHVELWFLSWGVVMVSFSANLGGRGVEIESKRKWDCNALSVLCVTRRCRSSGYIAVSCEVRPNGRDHAWLGEMDITDVVAVTGGNSGRIK